MIRARCREDRFAFERKIFRPTPAIGVVLSLLRSFLFFVNTYFFIKTHLGPGACHVDRNGCASAEKNDEPAQ